MANRSSHNRPARLRVKRRFIVALAIVVMLLCPHLDRIEAAQKVNPRAVIAKADKARGNYAGIQWLVEIEAKDSGGSQDRTLVVQSLGYNSLAEFIAPAKVRGQKLLMKDRNMWFVKPGLQKPVPISPRQKLLGGAANGDIASTDYAGDFEATYIRKEAVGGIACYLFDLAATSKRATYDKIRYWISVKDSLGLKAEFYTVSGKLVKSAVFEYNNRLTIDKRKQRFVSKMTISDHILPDRTTTLVYKDVELKTIPLETFNLNFLMR